VAQAGGQAGRWKAGRGGALALVAEALAVAEAEADAVAARGHTHRLGAVAEAVEQHGQDLDDVRLKQPAQLITQALKGQQGACGE